MHRLPIVQYKFITPKTEKVNKGEITHTYDFYFKGGFEKYLKDEKEHPVNNERAYDNFEEYMSKHTTKEDGEQAHIQTFTNAPENVKTMAKNSLIYSSVISLDEDTSSVGGFGDNQTKKRVCDYFFNQMMKFHHYDKNDWCYFAAEHTNTKHTHMHILIYQPSTVKNEKVMDWKIKANCMTSRWVGTNTVRFTQAVVKNLNNEFLQTLLKHRHELQNSFKKEIKNKEYLPKIAELASDLLNTKGKSGKLQYNQLARWSSVPVEKFERMDKKTNSLSPIQAKMFLAKLDSLADVVVKNSPEMSKQLEVINKIQDQILPINTPDKQVNKLNLDKRFEYEWELKSNLGNAILNEIKDNTSVSLFLMSNKAKKEYRLLQEKLGIAPKHSLNCRTYKHALLQSAMQASKKFEFNMHKIISSSYQINKNAFMNYVKQSEFGMER